jgi:neutral ceramidase
LYARAVIVAEADKPSQRAVFVNLDACMASQAVTFTVIDHLKARFGDTLYTEQNVVLSGTHTHSGPAGYLQYLVYDVTGLGFVPQTFHALVDGIERAIVQAHESLQPGRLRLAHGELLEANVNRSPTAYDANPSEERAKYAHNVDKEMSLLVMEDASMTTLGAFSWFAVHGTSMNNTNALVNGDNKGAAAQLMERRVAKRAATKGDRFHSRKNGSTFPNTTSYSENFVASFCQANVGDTSPNTLGAFCMDTGLPCDAVHSTCGGRVQQCIGRGPGWPDHFSSTKIIASKQATKAEELLQNRDNHSESKQ